MPHSPHGQTSSGSPKLTYAAGLMLAASVGAMISAFVVTAQVAQRPAVSPEAFTVVTHDQKVATQKVAADLAALGARLDALTQTTQRGRTVDDSRMLRAQIDRLDARIERVRQDGAGQVAPLVGRFEQLDRQQRDLAARLAEMTERLDQIERQYVITGSIPR